MITSTLAAPVSVRRRPFGAALLELRGGGCQCGYPRIDVRAAGGGALAGPTARRPNVTSVEAAGLTVDNSSALQNLWKAYWV